MVRVESELTGALRHALLSTLLGLRNGFQYGVKIRAPHSLVMTFLFKPNNPIKDNLLAILKMSFAHARNLGAFVLIYKSMLSSLRVLYTAVGAKIVTAGGEPARFWHAALAGWVGAHLVWAKHSGVNEQICLYLLSRVIMGFFKLLAKNGVKPFKDISFKQAYPLFACGVWAAVMWMYETNPKVLQPSLEASMRYLYHDTNTWTRGAENFLPNLPSVAVFSVMCWLYRSRIADLFDLAKRL